MKNLIFLVLCFSLFSCQKISSLLEHSVPIKTDEEKMSYMLGYIISENTKKTEVLLVQSAFLQGVKDNLNNKEPVLTKEDMNKIKEDIEKTAHLKKTEEKKKEQKMKSQNFLEENKKREEVKVTDSNLQYEVLQEGKGEYPQLTDVVEVHYKGTLIDGLEFDNSYKRGTPAKFPLKGVIKGWQEGLQLMKEGAKYKFYIPSNLAYGEQGAGQIPAHSTLIFEVELIKVFKK
ncbi:MAG: FKBP-type peptidyl-prolyl cis-trans isomerase [Bdellovibrionales bacterium]|nr:FKBP-type peptidyl-prolyl cis-trans isomerase [Bdellovibrionales bacterium]